MDQFITSLLSLPECEYTEICQMIERRMDGIPSRAIHPIANGPLEGTNNMIKHCIGSLMLSQIHTTSSLRSGMRMD